MKQLSFLLTIILFSSFANAQDTVKKIYKDATGVYAIVYKYSSWCATVPLVGRINSDLPADEPHYPATIRVYKKKKQVGREMQGTYVPGGCFEDVPAEWVKKAFADQRQYDKFPTVEEHLEPGDTSIPVHDCPYTFILFQDSINIQQPNKK